ncbi:MAG TPA: group 1 truncated hemoglobin [Gemmataceae bacterium]|jgi:hemoglobin|nr:group 1 truncated hemoglobin [Gemmataceae bacterium]
MFTTAFASLTVCCCCWFGCCKPSHQPVYVYPAPYYGPAIVNPGTPMPHHDAVMEKKAMPTDTPKKSDAPKEKSLYERLGGEAAIKAVVDDFVARAAGNPKVNFTRKGTDKEWKPTPENVEHVKKGLVDLVGMVTGGPQKYTGGSMKDVHKGMKITQDEFNALAADLKATLDKFKVPAKEQDELMKIVGSTAGDIVERK